MREPWLIDSDYAITQIPLIANLILGNPVALDMDDDEEEEKGPPQSKVVSIDGQEVTVISKSRYWHDLTEAPKGSIARVSIDDVMMKHDFCGAPGTMSLASFIEECDASENIAATYVEIDCPGGSIYGVQTLTDAIRNHHKPIICHVMDGIAASGGYWAAVAGDKLYASQKTDEVGSIGVFISFRDFQPYFEKQGVKFHTIYSSLSEDKNKPFRAALQGDYEPMTIVLDRVATEFITHVKNHRAIDTKQGNPFKGAMFSAVDAEKIGLIDGIRSQQEVFAELIQMSKQDNFYV